ncbi:carboxypeptidase-like regulatory domain-containing protein [Miltoncostaea oceani]|uniref:carboxypeptidase-like regulatory domain-containing protein n=1 Tax=Miltoncostaea oceani TaxID=2843216 RepID=UPI001C3CCC4E|nr:carboxypeptidase-like regulatory domain-containing protein [Miltoncostaea oceani]
MSRRRHIVAAVAATLAAGAVLAPPAAATDGNLYPAGSSIWATSTQFSATVLAGPVWQVQAPALAPANAGNHWEMNWGCPVAGSEIASVHFGGLRTQAPSSLALRVTGNRNVLWEEGDAAMPTPDRGGRPYVVGLPGGQCNVHLALTQVETRNQHARGYFIDNPRILVRDLTGPEVALRGLSGGWIRAGAAMRVDWATSDNFGSDGVGQQRVVVAGQVRWAGAPGVGLHGLEVGLDGVPDGVHRVEVQADGDGTAGGAAAGTVHVDRTPPAASALAAALTAQPGVLAFSWRAADNLSGVAATAVDVNTAAGGAGSGEWREVASAAGPGPHALQAAATDVPDGVHAWRVRTTDVAGNVSVTPGPSHVVVDRAAPRLDLHGVPAGWVAKAELDLGATDELETALGPVGVEIDVNTAADGGESGEWQRRATSPGPAGRRIVALDLAGLEPGRHAVRITARNGGPLGATLATERRTMIRVDDRRPEISRAAFTAAAGRPMSVTWVAEDAHAGVATATVQWRDGATWRTLGTEAATDGAGTMVVDVSALPAGDRPVRLLIGDGAGNAALRTGSVTLAGGGGAGSTASDPVARLRAARLTLSIDGGRTERRDGRTVVTRRVSAGRTITVRGRLTDRSGRAIVGSEIQARGHRGRLVGRALTRRDGRFTLVARPVAGGPLTVGVLALGRLLPDRPVTGLRVEVRPRIALDASATNVGLGQTVLFAGRLSPAPGDLGLGARKGVVLEWLDPIRHTWRPVVNARTRRDGTFAIPWTYGVRGLTIPMRVTVPGEVGWPLLPVRSRVIRVTVSG